MSKVAVGDVVVYVDAVAREHKAVVTAVWGNAQYGPDFAPAPSLNIVLVSTDESKTDCYGRQIERQTSVVHKSAQPAHGFYWREL